MSEPAAAQAPRLNAAGSLREAYDRRGQDGRATNTHVKINVGGQIVTATITNESANEPKLAAGQTAYAIVKAWDMMMGVD